MTVWRESYSVLEIFAKGLLMKDIMSLISIITKLFRFHLVWIPKTCLFLLLVVMLLEDKLRSKKLTRFYSFLLGLAMWARDGHKLITWWQIRLKIIKTICFIHANHTCALADETSLCDIKTTRIDRCSLCQLRKKNKTTTAIFYLQSTVTYKMVCR